MALLAILSFSQLGLLFGIVVTVYLAYTVYLHPLASYPGPKTWAISRLPWCWNQYYGNLSQRLLELHDQYGPVVRISPNELSYTTNTAWKTIYGPRSNEMQRDPNFKLITPNGVENIMTSGRESHARQRRVLSYAFSEKALREQEPIMQAYCTKLCSILTDLQGKGAVDMEKWFTFATFDLIGDLSFGESFGCMDSGEPHGFVTALKSGSRELMILQMMKFYRVTFLTPLLGMLGVFNKGSRATNMKRAMETVRARIARGPTSDRRDFWHYILDHVKQESEASGQKVAMTEAEMYANAFSISGAGSEGTATTLTGATYLLASHPEIYTKVVNEIRTAFSDPSQITIASTAAELPTLTAALKETMRLYPSIAITFPRQVPEPGEVIDGQYVPGGTSVGINHFAAYRSKHNFDDADKFLPERWLNGEAPGCFQPFSYGPRNCLGKNIAWAELRLMLAHILWRFDVQVVDQQEGWLNQRLWGFWQKSPLMCKLIPVNHVVNTEEGDGLGKNV